MGVQISSKRNLKEEVKSQVIKGAKFSGCLTNLVWKNKFMSAESKIRIYKTCVRPIITYGAEFKAATIVTK